LPHSGQYGIICSPYGDGQGNLAQKFIIAEGDVINYGLTWQTVFDTVFGFQFSVFG
jgi:hypothetical protein